MNFKIIYNIDEPLKALVLENEFILPKETKSFLDTHKDLFESVNIQIACLNRPLEDLGRFISQVDTIIFQTGYFYKDQFSKFIKAFLYGPFINKQYTFFIYNFENFFKDLLEHEADEKQDLIDLIKKSKIYSYNEKSFKEFKIEAHVKI